MALSANERSGDEVRAIASVKLHALKDWLDSPAGALQVVPDRAHIWFAAKEIEQFEKDPKRIDLTPPAEPPDGQPIGTDDDWDWEN